MDKLLTEGVKVNEVEKLEEFRNKIAPWREKYLKEKGQKFEKLYQKIQEVK